ncbi:MAG: CPBP family intramembrane metalloprotease [Ruminococcus sp.]|nr:CPBP family intramembrane metalloprotease [Ruminococcus sp.]
MDQFNQFGQYGGYGGYGAAPQGDPVMLIQEQKKQEKHGLFIAAAKLGALLIIYEVLTTAISYAYYYVLYYIKSGSFTIDFGVVREYMRERPEIANSSFYRMLGNLSIVLTSLTILLLLAVLVFKVDLKPMLKPEKKKIAGGAKWFTLSMSVNVAVSIVVSIIVMMLSSAGVTVPESDFSMSDGNTGTLIMQFLYVVALGPVCEELLYRGIIITLLKPYGKGLAVFFSAFIFGYMHGNIPQFASAFAGGLVFAAIAVKYDSIVPTIVMHIMNNICASIGDFAKVMDVSEEFSNNLYYGVVIACGIIGMYMLFVNIKELKPVEEKTFLLTAGERRRAVFLNIVMLIYFGWIFVEYITSFIKSN